MYLGDEEKFRVAETVSNAILGALVANGRVPNLLSVWVEDPETGERHGPIEFVFVKDERGPYFESVTPLEIGGVPGAKLRVRVEERP